MTAKRILVLFGGYRKKETLTIVEQFSNSVRTLIEAEIEIIMLKDADLRQCRGCFCCLTRGDEFCPHSDDRAAIVGKMLGADGVIFATPNYALQVTALMKNFLDRIAYTFHRPCFFHSKGMAIVTQGAIGAGGILRYFRDVMRFTGFDHVPGLALTTVSPRTAREQRLIDRKTADAARRFVEALQKDLPAKTPLLQFLAFRMVRSMYRATPDETLKDVHYFRDNGWFASEYYYPVRTGVHYKLLGRLIDACGSRFARTRKKELLP